MKNSKVAKESLDKKRTFLQQKGTYSHFNSSFETTFSRLGLTENEINYAFKLVPQQQQQGFVFIFISHQLSLDLVVNHQPSFFRRLFSDLLVAGLIGLAIKLFKDWFQSVRKIQVLFIFDFRF